MAEQESKPAKSSAKKSGSADAQVERIKAEAQADAEIKVAAAERMAAYETPEQQGLSRQAQFSTYSEKTDLPEQNPPLGSHVEQELGEPSEGQVEAFKGISG